MCERVCRVPESSSTAAWKSVSKWLRKKTLRPKHDNQLCSNADAEVENEGFRIKTKISAGKIGCDERFSAETSSGFSERKRCGTIRNYLNKIEILSRVSNREKKLCLCQKNVPLTICQTETLLEQSHAERREQN